MRRIRGRLALCFYVWLVSSTAAAQLGSPTDPFSCYSHCGETRTSGTTVTCYCDLWCESRGDCCADMNAYCGAEAGAPYCALTNNTPGAASEFGNFCGTDLGFVFPHGGTLNVLFGDSWQYKDATTCEDRGIVPENDDAQATLPLARPAWAPTSATAPGAAANSCPANTLTMQMSGGTFRPITLKDALNNPVTLGVGNTPLTGFSDGVNAWALFGVGGQLFGGEALRDVHIAYRSGTATNYRTLVTLGLGNKFENPSAAVVTSLSNFDPPASGGTLLLFGRPRFNSATNQSASSNLVYLLRQNLPLNINGGVPPAGTFNWSPQYFGGFNTNGSVNWTSIAGATPVVTSDFKITNQLDVKWVPQLKKWVMLYGGSIFDASSLNSTTSTDQPRHGAIHMRIADLPWGPWSAPAPALMREKMGPYYHCDATGVTNPAGCDIAPWALGTWTQGGAANIPFCNASAQQPFMPNYLIPLCAAPNLQQRGNLYSPNMLVPWTLDGGFEPISRRRSATLYFTVSTWTPYQVTLNVLDLRLFEQPTYPFGGIYVQLRDQANGMVSRTGTNQVSHVAGSTAPHATAATKFVVDWAGSGSTPSRGPALGDTVVLANGSNGNKLLARSGSTLTYVDSVAPYPASALWVLESTSTAAYPNGTPIVWGTTPFRLKAPTSSSRLSSSAFGTLSVSTATPGTTFNWTFKWACLSGDTCTPKQ